MAQDIKQDVKIADQKKSDCCSSASQKSHCAPGQTDEDKKTSGCPSKPKKPSTKAALTDPPIKQGRSDTDYSALAQRLHTQDPASDFELTVGITGVNCAACINLIESSLLQNSQVTNARVNMTTRRLTFSWQNNGADSAYLANELVETVEALGYKIAPLNQQKQTASEEAYQKYLLRAIAVAAFAVGNIMLLSITVWTSDGQAMGGATRSLFHWISALIALPTIIYAGRPFFRSAWAVLKNRRTNMDVPISLALILASALSLYETITASEHVYFDSAVMLLLFLLIGRYLDARAKGKARLEAENLLSMLSGTATILKDGTTQSIPIKDLRPGMIVLVSTGERLPGDGTVTKGISSIDMSLITGETIPQTVQTGDDLFAGTLNLDGPLQMKISKASNKSLLSEIVKLMDLAGQSNSQFVRIAERAARLYVPVVHSMALLTFLGWLFIAGATWQTALIIAITVLIITCPCALGLAVPVVQVLASGKLMKKGILLKSGDALEKLALIDTAVFDKTGTLTKGTPAPILNERAKEKLPLAASLAKYSHHPLSKALADFYNGPLEHLDNIKELPGKGLEASYQGKTIRLGAKKWCLELNDKTGDLPIEDSSTTQLQIWFACNEQSPIPFYFSDQTRHGADQVINILKTNKITPHLLSGDRIPAVKKMADTLKITQWHGAQSPLEKCEKLESLKQKGHKILMVGDGLNDAPSLAMADVSISPSSAIDMTQNSADIIFQSEDLTPVLTSWQTAVRVARLVKENFALAIIYNLIAIPLAVAGLVTPLIAAVAMSLSSLIVIGNSFRILKD